MPTNGMVSSASVALLCLFGLTAVASDVQILDLEDHGELSAEAIANSGITSGEAIDSCDLCCQVPHWFVGTEVMMLSIDTNNNGRTTLTLDESGTAGLDQSLIANRGVNDFGFAPRLWLGRKFGNNWGVQARYFDLSDSAGGAPTNPVGFTPLPNFGTYRENNRTELYAVDLEAIRTFRPGLWTIDATLGARHASLSNDGNMIAFGVFTTGNFINLYYANGASFDGSGVTGSLTIRRASQWQYASYFIGARASGMWGRTDSFASTSGTVASSPSAPLVGAATVTRANAIGTMNISELQAGMEWDVPLQGLPCYFFFRASIEYQHWVVQGLPTGGAGFGGTIGTLTTNSFTSAGGDPEANLVGASISTGLTW